MKELTDVQTFMKMLSESDEFYNKLPLGEGTRLEFPTRKISFYFDKDGKFVRIVDINKSIQ